MNELTRQAIYEAFDSALREVARRYVAGELDMSGKYESSEVLTKLAQLPRRENSPEAAA